MSKVFSKKYDKMFKKFVEVAPWVKNCLDIISLKKKWIVSYLLYQAIQSDAKRRELSVVPGEINEEDYPI